MVKVAWPSPTGVRVLWRLWPGGRLQPWLAKRAAGARPGLVAGAVGADADRRGRAAADRRRRDPGRPGRRGRHRASAGAAANAGGGAGRRCRRLHSPAPRRRRDRLLASPGLCSTCPRTATHACCANFGAALSGRARRFRSSTPMATRSVAATTLHQAADRAGFPSTTMPDARIAPRSTFASRRVIHRPIFAFGAPIRGPDGQFAGLVAEIDRIDPSRRTDHPGQRRHRTCWPTWSTRSGRVIAHPDAALVASFADLSATPPVAAFLSAAGCRAARMTYSAADGEQLVGYASLGDLGWGVIVERPTARRAGQRAHGARAGIRRVAGVRRRGRAGRGVLDAAG